jgi:arylsulfatase A-like enzyme
MRSIGIDDQTLLIITSDHGEELFEHGGLGHHRNKLYQELIHVPLVMVLPGREAAGKVIETPVSTIDLMPTILEIAGVLLPDDIPGKSLVPLLRGETMPPRPLFAEVNDFKSNTRAIIEYPWKYLYNMGLDYGELYNIESDPREKNDVNDQQPEIRDGMRKSLDTWMEQTKPRWPWVKPLPLTPDDVKRLQQMGYLMQ